MSRRRNKANQITIPESVPIDVDIRPAADVLQSAQQNLFDQLQASSIHPLNLRLKLLKAGKPVAGARLSFKGVDPPAGHNLPRTISATNGIGYLAIQPSKKEGLPKLGIEASLKDGKAIIFDDIPIPGDREKESISSEGYTLELSTASIVGGRKPFEGTLKPRVMESALVGSRTALKSALPKLKQYSCFKISALFVVGKNLNRLPREFNSYSVQLLKKDFRDQLGRFDAILDLSNHAIVQRVQADLVSGNLTSRAAILTGGDALLEKVQAVAQALA